MSSSSSPARSPVSAPPSSSRPFGLSLEAAASASLLSPPPLPLPRADIPPTAAAPLWGSANATSRNTSSPISTESSSSWLSSNGCFATSRCSTAAETRGTVGGASADGACCCFAGRCRRCCCRSGSAVGTSSAAVRCRGAPSGVAPRLLNKNCTAEAASWDLSRRRPSASERRGWAAAAAVATKAAALGAVAGILVVTIDAWRAGFGCRRQRLRLTSRWYCNTCFTKVHVHVYYSCTRADTCCNKNITINIATLL